METLDAGDLVVDLVYGVHVIEHVEDVEKLLRVAKGLLAPGGRLVLLTPAADSWGLRLFGSSWWLLEDPTHVRFFTARSVRLACESAGFAAVTTRRLWADNLTMEVGSIARVVRVAEDSPGGVLSSRIVMAAGAAQRPARAAAPVAVTAPAAHALRRGAGRGVTGGREALPGGHALGWGLRRSVQLMLAFRVEQTDPHRFYRLLAEDSLNTIRQVAEPRGSLVLDIGAGPAEFAACFGEAGARYVPLDRDEQAPSLRSGGMVGSAEQLPLRDDSVDIVFSSNLLEHVPDPERAADEMVRVAAPGGDRGAVLHQLALAMGWARDFAVPLARWRPSSPALRAHARPTVPRTSSTRTSSASRSRRWCAGRGRRTDADIVLLRPRYLPPWFGWIVRVPVLRELVTWNLLIVLRKR